MGDPGLGARHLPGVAIPNRARAQRAEVGPGFRLGEDGGGDDLPRRDGGQKALLLLAGAVGEDQFGCDLRAGAKRAGPDPAARQRLGHHAHRHLAQSRSAIGLRGRQAKDP